MHANKHKTEISMSLATGEGLWDICGQRASAFGARYPLIESLDAVE